MKWGVSGSALATHRNFCTTSSATFLKGRKLLSLLGTDCQREMSVSIDEFEFAPPPLPERASLLLGACGSSRIASRNVLPWASPFPKHLARPGVSFGAEMVCSGRKIYMHQQ